MDNLALVNFDTVFYHKGCPDGILAAWVYSYKVKKDSIDFVAMDAGRYPTEYNVKDKTILMVDVCPKRNEIVNISKECKFLLIIDHHKSALADCKDLLLENVKIIFDMNKCGCQISWDVFGDKTNYPWFIEVVADRDLWKWQYPNSKELGAFLYHKNYYTNWNIIPELFNFTDKDMESAISIGSTILSIEELQIKNTIKQAIKTTFIIDDIKYDIVVVGCPHNIASEVGNRLSVDCDFVALWRYSIQSDEWFISCRTSKDNIDLSQITKKFGGGGHPKAAGFSINNKKTTIKDFFNL